MEVGLNKDDCVRGGDPCKLERGEESTDVPRAESRGIARGCGEECWHGRMVYAGRRRKVGACR
jgi:hypothetical protein